MIAPNHDPFAIHPLAARATKAQGAVGVIEVEGAALRARLRGGLQSEMLMLTASARQPRFCAGAKPTIPIAATVPMHNSLHERVVNTMNSIALCAYSMTANAQYHLKIRLKNQQTTHSMHQRQMLNTHALGELCEAFISCPEGGIGRDAGAG